MQIIVYVIINLEMQPAHFGHTQCKQKGFTLVELLVVISIIAILSVIGITIFTSVQSTARDGKRRADLDTLRKAFEQYRLQNNTYSPATQPFLVLMVGVRPLPTPHMV